MTANRSGTNLEEVMAKKSKKGKKGKQERQKGQKIVGRP